MAAKIGFIGQGWIGKHYADDFENRGYDVVRYSLEEPYVQNKDSIKECDVVFIAVPTPTTPKGFDDSIVREAVTLVGSGMTAVIKSTMLPGTTESIQYENPDITVLHSPEFLREASAVHDAAHPDRNVVGISQDTEKQKKAAKFVLAVLPEAPYEAVVPALEAELIKYVGNCFLYSKVVFMNILHDMVKSTGADWEIVRTAMAKDPRIGESHTNPVHDGGRGAGGHCFIKDFEAFRNFYRAVDNKEGNDLLKAFVDVNNMLLIRSGKSIDLLEGVYGKEYIDSLQK